MNVSADVLWELAQASGAPTDFRAEGVVRYATERLKGEKEWWVEVFEHERWETHAVHPTRELARLEASGLRYAQPAARVRVVELLRRVLP